MPDNNMIIMLGLGAAALWFMNRGGSQEDQVDQLAGASMMASGEGTTPDAPFQAYSAPANPVFFFNEGGQMALVPGTNVPMAAASGEDIGVYPGRYNQPELEFEVARSNPPVGTTDISPTTPEFAGDGTASVTASTIWDDPGAIGTDQVALPMIGIRGGDIVASNVDISNLSSKEAFRAVDLGSSGAPTGFNYKTTGDVFTAWTQYVGGATNTPPAAPTNAVVVSQTATNGTSLPDWAVDAWWDEG